MIGKKISNGIEEMENTLWEYEAFNGAKPNYTLEGFRASTKIFMSALLDKFFEKQQAEGVSQEDTLKAVEKLGQDVRALVFNAITEQKLIKILSMKAKQFKEVNAVYGENQPEYYPLPAYKSEDGTAVFCFELDEEERRR